MEKRILDEDAEAYKVLAMLLEPIVSEFFEKMKEKRQVVLKNDELVKTLGCGDESGEKAFLAKRDKGLAQIEPTPLSD